MGFASGVLVCQKSKNDFSHTSCLPNILFMYLRSSIMLKVKAIIVVQSITKKSNTILVQSLLSNLNKERAFIQITFAI